MNRHIDHALKGTNLKIGQTQTKGIGDQYAHVLKFFLMHKFA